MKEGIVLFAHGSRERDWAKPFERIAQQLAASHVVELAYLERMKPTLDDAIGALIARGIGRVRIVPVFLGVGGHVKQDLPKLADAARARHAGVDIVLEKTIGEREEITQAIAAVISKGISLKPR